MTLWFREQEIETLVSMQDAIAAVERVELAYAAGRAFSNPRERVRVPGGMLHLMAAASVQDELLGFKAYTSFGRSVRFHLFLYGAKTGTLEAVIDAARLGQLRTGAATAVAARRMARPGTRTLGVIGAGFQAAAQLDALAQVCTLDRVRVYSRQEAARVRFCEEARTRTGLVVEPADDARSAVEGANLVVTATTSAQPVLEGEWLAPGSHVSAIGANSLTRREIAGSVIRRAARIVVDSVEQARLESGALTDAVERGHLRWEQVRPLRDVVAGMVPGRTSDEEVTLFHSLGSATWDLALGALVLERGRANGLGQALPFG